MELADIGHPRALARAIHSQIRDQIGSVPTRFPLKVFSDLAGVISVESIDSDKIDGMLVVQSGQAVIGLNSRLSVGRRRFTWAHELGHLLIPTHLGGKERFRCSRRAINMERPPKGLLKETVSRAERKEIEANEFAAELLVPAKEYRELRKKLSDRPDISHLDTIRQEFSVSREMLARVYVSTEDNCVAILTSRHGKIQQMILPKSFPYMGLRKGASLPAGTSALDFARASRDGETRSNRGVSPALWFEDDRDVLYANEQTLGLSRGWAITLIEIGTREAREDDYGLLMPTDRMRERGRKGRFSWDD